MSQFMSCFAGSNGSTGATDSQHYSHRTSSHSSGTKSQPVSRQATPQRVTKPSGAEAQPPPLTVPPQLPALPSLEPLVHTPHRQRELGSISRPSSSSSQRDTSKSADKPTANGQASKLQAGHSGALDAQHKHRLSQPSFGKGSAVAHQPQHQRPGEHHRSHSQSHRHHHQQHLKHSRDRPDRPHEKPKERHHPPHQKSQTARPVPGHPHSNETQPSKKRRMEELEPGEIPDDDTQTVGGRPPPIPPLPPLPNEPPPSLPPPPPGH